MHLTFAMKAFCYYDHERRDLLFLQYLSGLSQFWSWVNCLKDVISDHCVSFAIYYQQWYRVSPPRPVISQEGKDGLGYSDRLKVSTICVWTNFCGCCFTPPNNCVQRSGTQA